MTKPPSPRCRNEAHKKSGAAIRLRGSRSSSAGTGRGQCGGIDLESGREFLSLLGPSETRQDDAAADRRIRGARRRRHRARQLLHDRTPPDKRPVNTVFQSYALFPHMMTVAESICHHGLRRQRTWRAEDRPPRQGTACAYGKLRRTAQESPGDWQQRVALAPCPGEPAEGAAARRAVSAAMHRHRARNFSGAQADSAPAGITFNVHPHDGRALSMSDRVSPNDRAAICSSRWRIYQSPANSFVAASSLSRTSRCLVSGADHPHRTRLHDPARPHCHGRTAVHPWWQWCSEPSPS